MPICLQAIDLTIEFTTLFYNDITKNAAEAYK